jgi:hypothetical protein
MERASIEPAIKLLIAEIHTHLAFAECHDMISALPADRSDQPFGIRILPW